MRRFQSAVAAVILSLASACRAQTPPPVTAADVMISVQFATAEMLTKQQNYDLVIESLKTAMSDGVYSRLSPGKQYQVAVMDGDAAFQVGRWDHAHAAFVRATASTQASTDDWVGRLQSAIFADDAADAWRSFQHFAALGEGKTVVGTFGSEQMAHFQQLVGQLPNSAEANIAVGDALDRSDWTPVDPYDTASTIWLHYTLALVERGDIVKAIAVAPRITDPAVLSAMQADRRFDPVVASDPARYDPKTAALRKLKAAQAMAAQYPNFPAAKIAVSRALTVMDRYQDSFDLVDKAIVDLAQADPEKAPINDPQNADVILSERNGDLLALGHEDEAIANATAAVLHEQTPYATYTLGRLLVSAGRPQEALRWLNGARRDTLTLQEQMDLSSTTACADAQVGDQAAFAQQFAFLDSHRSWKPVAVVEALVCSDRLDAAAATIEADLGDPQMRLPILAALQTFAEEPHMPKWRGVVHARWKTLQSMPQVADAVAKVGRIRSDGLTDWNLQL